MNLEALNPKKVTMVVGIKDSYTITIYPLSFGDELEFTEVLSQIISEYAELPEDEKSEMSLISIAVENLKRNIPKLIPLLIDQDEWERQAGDKSLLKCMDNEQIAELITYILDMNFGSNVEKKVRSLVEKARNIFQQKMPTPPSVN